MFLFLFLWRKVTRKGRRGTRTGRGGTRKGRRGTRRGRRGTKTGGRRSRRRSTTSSTRTGRSYGFYKTSHPTLLAETRENSLIYSWQLSSKGFYKISHPTLLAETRENSLIYSWQLSSNRPAVFNHNVQLNFLYTLSTPTSILSIIICFIHICMYFRSMQFVCSLNLYLKYCTTASGGNNNNIWR